MKLVASKVIVSVGDNWIEIDIYVDSEGNLILKGLEKHGRVNYDLCDEVLMFMPSRRRAV